MIINYFKTAWRNLIKNKVFSLINIAGLSIGMAACLLIMQYVSFELSYDRFNPNAADIYRVVNDRYQNGKLVQHGTITYSGVGVAMKNDYPEIVNHTRIAPIGSPIISYKDKKLGNQDCVAADNAFLTMLHYTLLAGNAFLTMLHYTLLAGNAATALKEPNTVVLTEKLAQSLFGVKGNYTALLGKTIVLQRDSMPYLITGICSNFPENSHLEFDILISYVSLYKGNGRWKQAEYDFTDSDFWHYIQLRHGTDYKAFEKKLPAFSQKYFQGNKISGSDETFYLQPLLKAHLYSDFEYEIGRTGSATVVWGLLIIALFIIVIAWVNYINLSTAKSMERAKEVGVRKVSGATQWQLIRQFLTESVLINILALLLAVVIVLLAQNSFNRLVQHDLSLSYLFQKGLSGYNITISLFILIVSGILVSGFYPAFVLSSFRPILVLKGKFINTGKGMLLRKALVIGQFTVTVGLIIGSIVVHKQIRFLNEQDLGMNLSQLLVVQGPQLTDFDSTFIDQINSFKEELKQMPHIHGATNIQRVPGREMARAFNVHRADDNSGRTLTMRNLGASYDFLDVYGIKLLTGRNFSPSDYNPDWNKLHTVILNASAVKLLGYADNNEAVGQSIMALGKKWDVIGVINDYHQKTLRYAVEPMMLVPAYRNRDAITVKVDAKDVTATVAAIKKKYDDFFPGNLFDYFFMDERFNALYNDDKLFGKVFALFAGFAIFIACLGLLGLSLFSTTQRIKEIGVRKVMGASISNIVMLISKDFIKLICIAFVIATPLAWYVMHNWLQDYAYRISISWWMFAGAGLLALLISLATISFLAIKAAMTNPVKSLRTE